MVSTASALLFDFDAESFNYNILDNENWNADAGAFVQAPSCQLPRRLSFAEWLSEPATGNDLQRKVHKALQEQSLPTQFAHFDVSDLCTALRRRGLDARLMQPALPGGVRCGRRSTGGGGQCAAAAGGSCYFCSRQPYAVVLGPLGTLGPPGSLGCPPPLATGSVAAGGCCAYTDVASSCSTNTGNNNTCGSNSNSDSVCSAVAAASVLSEPLPQPPPAVTEGGSGAVLVDPHLREMFRVSPSTAEYAAAVAAIPEVWVGPREALLQLASSMCTAMALNFRIQGLDVPPWRRRKAVLSRWAPLPLPAAFSHLPQHPPPCNQLPNGTGASTCHLPPHPHHHSHQSYAYDHHQQHIGSVSWQHSGRQQRYTQGGCSHGVGAPAVAFSHSSSSSGNPGCGCPSGSVAAAESWPPGNHRGHEFGRGQGTATQPHRVMIAAAADAGVVSGGVARAATQGRAPSIQDSSAKEGHCSGNTMVKLAKEGGCMGVACVTHGSFGGEGQAPAVVVYGFDLPGPARAG